MESRIIVLGFDNQYAAEGMLEDLNRMQDEGLIDLEDAVVASRDVGTRVRKGSKRPWLKRTNLSLVEVTPNSSFGVADWVGQDTR